MRFLAIAMCVLSLAPLAAQTASTARGPVIDVPRNAAPVVDGTLDRGEWARAEPDRLSDGSIIRLQHDGRHLFLAIESATLGFPSVCVARDTEIRVLHASAALGSVTYTRSSDEWTTTATEFVYGMRNPALTDAARGERRAYLTQHGWVASTYSMSGGRVQEMQIALDVTGRTPRLALGYFVEAAAATPTIASWPRSMPSADGCAHTRLVTGYVPPRLHFQPGTWATLNLK